ncbi:alginate export family protein [Sphingobium rhizovicinum]|uniref:Alginate export family protein n=1 Tax=Sphingobium rhizovicinum TaxID=432308 RepID=A0ABV7NIA9_9SPHN
MAPKLIGTRYGPNTPLAFDGVRGSVSLGKGRKLDLFLLNPVQPGPDSFDDRTSDTRKLWGAYATLPELDLYYLGYRNRAACFGGLTRGRSATASAPAPMACGIMALECRGRLPVRPLCDQRISAWTLGSEVGRSLPFLPLSPTPRCASTSSRRPHRGDGTLGTFNALFPKGKYFGELSPVGPTNIVSLNPRISAPLGNGFSASLAAMAYCATPATTASTIYPAI